MKKTAFRITGLLFLVAAMVGLMACGSEETVTYKGEQFGVSSEVTYVAKGDEVTKQTIKSDMPYSMLGVESKEEAEETLDDLFRSELEAFNDIEGVEIDLKYEDDKIAQTIAIDYSVADLEEIKSLPGADLEGPKDADYVSLEKSVKLLENEGFEKVE